MATDITISRAVLVTGASGYIGRQLIELLANDRRGLETIVAMDLRELDESARLSGVEYCSGDIRDPAIAKTLARYRIDCVVHLASIVTPGKDDTADFEYSVDVLGTRNILEACLSAGVGHFIVTSSGAAYGYHADNPERLYEDYPLRGNESFLYSRHKRQVEEMLAVYRREHPELGQLVLRPGTVLGASVANQITAMFERPVIIGIRGAEVPFVFIWDQDVVACIREAIEQRRRGIYNLAGDGVMTLAEIAKHLGKPYLALPACLVQGALSLLHPLGIAPYGPEQVDFLRYRPVLANDRLKSDFGYTPRLSSAEVFEFYWRSRGSGERA